jgi:hypothetical protein
LQADIVLVYIECGADGDEGEAVHANEKYGKVCSPQVSSPGADLAIPALLT